MASATRGHTVETKVKMQPSVEHSTEREISTPDVNTAVPTDGVEMSWIDPPLRQQHSTTARQQAAAAAVTPLPSNVKLSKSTWPHITCQRFLFSGGVGSVLMNTISSIGSSEKVGRWTKAEGGGWGGGSYLAAGVSSPENFWNDGCTSVWYQLHRQSAVKLPRGGGHAFKSPMATHTRSDRGWSLETGVSSPQKSFGFLMLGNAYRHKSAVTSCSRLSVESVR